MIPKIIHYCWFGHGPMPELALKCIASWKKWCPDYQIMEWNEDNFDINSNRYVWEAYEAKKYAFVTDYVRLYAMYTVGGIYMDTDVMVLKSLDEYLGHEAFSGFETKTKISTGIMASVKGQRVVGELLKHYDDIPFINKDGTLNLTTNVETITNMMLQKGFVPNGQFQIIDNFAIYPQNVFCPDHKKLNDTVYMANAATVHYFAGSWKSESMRKRENSIWWKAIALPGMKLSKLLTFLLGDKWTLAKNKLRNHLFPEK